MSPWPREHVTLVRTRKFLAMLTSEHPFVKEAHQWFLQHCGHVLLICGPSVTFLFIVMEILQEPLCMAAAVQAVCQRKLPV